MTWNEEKKSKREERIEPSRKYSKEELESLLNFLADKGVISKNTVNWESFFSLFNKSEDDSYKYIDVFKITSPRQFGESWVQSFLSKNHPQLQKPSKALDPNYLNAQYDLWYKGLRIEVKASRAISSLESGPIINRALNTKDTDPFVMNFQQIKPDCCDIFILVAFWLDSYRLFCIPSTSIVKIPGIFNQHRNGAEKQLILNNKTINNLSQYEVADSDLEDYLDKVIQNFNKEK